MFDGVRSMFSRGVDPTEKQMDLMFSWYEKAISDMEALHAHVDEQVETMRKSAPAGEVERLRKQLSAAIGRDFGRNFN